MVKKPPLKILFGIALRSSREERELTQEKLAELADIDRTYIYRLENGKRAPSLEIIFRIADALKLTPGQLLDKVNKLRDR